MMPTNHEPYIVKRKNITAEVYHNFDIEEYKSYAIVKVEDDE